MELKANSPSVREKHWYAVFMSGEYIGKSYAVSEKEATNDVAYKRFCKRFTKPQLQKFRLSMTALELPQGVIRPNRRNSQPIDRLIACPFCSGFGHRGDDEFDYVCPHCNGLGLIPQSQAEALLS
ncbi:MAG: hypothetical protein ACM3NH_02070 [Candidatus Saccharibacteria bacterium]